MVLLDRRSVNFYTSILSFVLKGTVGTTNTSVIDMTDSSGDETGVSNVIALLKKIPVSFELKVSYRDYMKGLEN